MLFLLNLSVQKDDQFSLVSLVIQYCIIICLLQVALSSWHCVNSSDTIDKSFWTPKVILKIRELRHICKWTLIWTRLNGEELSLRMDVTDLWDLLTHLYSLLIWLLWRLLNFYNITLCLVSHAKSQWYTLKYGFVTWQNVKNVKDKYCWKELGSLKLSLFQKLLNFILFFNLCNFSAMLWAALVPNKTTSQLG